jgi:hypothetical protein
MKHKEMSPFQRKLAMLGTEMLPGLGSVLGAFAGGVGAPIGGALGNMASMGLKNLMPQEQQQPMNMGMDMQNPLVFGPEHEGYVNINQNPMEQMQQPYGNQNASMMGNLLGQGVGMAGMAGLQGLLSLLGGQQQPTARESLMAKMDGGLREKLVRMVALRKMLGEQ